MSIDAIFKNESNAVAHLTVATTTEDVAAGASVSKTALPSAPANILFTTAGSSVGDLKADVTNNGAASVTLDLIKQDDVTVAAAATVTITSVAGVGGTMKGIGFRIP